MSALHLFTWSFTRGGVVRSHRVEIASPAYGVVCSGLGVFNGSAVALARGIAAVAAECPASVDAVGALRPARLDDAETLAAELETALAMARWEPR